MTTSAPSRVGIDLDLLAERLTEARRNRTPIPRLTDEHPELTAAEAYAIQDRGIEHRLEAGERVVGAKLGFTSAAMQEAMGVSHPNFGWLTDAMLCSESTVPVDDLIHPKLEPEIAFVIGKDLAGPAVAAHDVLAATAAVLPILEIVDSRYIDFSFRALDNTADNSSAGTVVLGSRLVEPSFDLSKVGVALTVNGDLAYTAAGAAVLGHPANSVAWLVRRLAADGRGLRPGDLVISGGLTGPTNLHSGTEVTLEIDRIGSTSVRIT